jgi:hypothetical protein
MIVRKTACETLSIYADKRALLVRWPDVIRPVPATIPAQLTSSGYMVIVSPGRSLAGSGVMNDA